jgi:hypothetical protein
MKTTTARIVRGQDAIATCSASTSPAGVIRETVTSVIGLNGSMWGEQAFMSLMGSVTLPAPFV